jgi:hypothetical protein
MHIEGDQTFKLLAEASVPVSAIGKWPENDLLIAI